MNCGGLTSFHCMYIRMCTVGCVYVLTLYTSSTVFPYICCTVLQVSICTYVYVLSVYRSVSVLCYVMYVVHYCRHIIYAVGLYCLWHHVRSAW